MKAFDRIVNVLQLIMLILIWLFVVDIEFLVGQIRMVLS